MKVFYALLILLIPYFGISQEIINISNNLNQNELDFINNSNEKIPIDIYKTLNDKIKIDRLILTLENNKILSSGRFVIYPETPDLLNLSQEDLKEYWKNHEGDPGLYWSEYYLSYVNDKLIIDVFYHRGIGERINKTENYKIEKINGKYLTTFVANGGGMNILKIYLDNKLIFEEFNQ